MSDLPPQRIVLIVIAAVAVLAIGYRSMGSGDPPRAAYTGLPAAPAAPASAAVVVVDVVGAVREPGVYRFPDGARMQDAVKRARPLPGADLAGLNLAERLADGEQVVVPRRGAGGAAVVSSASGAAGSEIVHLNSATLEQLETLDGIGPSLAQRIVDYRTEHGGFRALEQLDDVSGFGPARMAALDGHVAL
jgi:competence protein ComEA